MAFPPNQAAGNLDQSYANGSAAAAGFTDIPIKIPPMTVHCKWLVISDRLLTDPTAVDAAAGKAVTAPSVGSNVSSNSSNASAFDNASAVYTEDGPGESQKSDVSRIEIMSETILRNSYRTAVRNFFSER